MSKHSKNNHHEVANEQKVSEQLAQNPNPRANENIRVRTDEAAENENNADTDIGSEITDGEDA
jgi:hypothetical protein